MAVDLVVLCLCAVLDMRLWILLLCVLCAVLALFINISHSHKLNPFSFYYACCSFLYIIYIYIRRAFDMQIDLKGRLERKS